MSITNIFNLKEMAMAKEDFKKVVIRLIKEDTFRAYFKRDAESALKEAGYNLTHEEVNGLSSLDVDNLKIDFKETNVDESSLLDIMLATWSGAMPANESVA
jgi:hypothetical protein